MQIKILLLKAAKLPPTIQTSLKLSDFTELYIFVNFQQISF